MNKTLKYGLILLLLSYVFFMFGNGLVNLTDPDEVFYTQTAKEMVEHDTWLTPYMFQEPQFEKPIFLYWAMRASFLVFGITNFGARFAPSFFAILGILAVYFLALVGFKNEKKAFICGLVMLSSGLYLGLARTVFTDMIFTVFILFSLAAFYWGYTENKRKGISIILCCVFSAFAVLTKGPLGFLIPFCAIAVFLALKKEIKYLFCRSSLWGILLFVLISFPWYIFVIKKYGGTFIQEFFVNDHYRRLIEAEHEKADTWFFYPSSMIGCMFPWSIFVTAAVFSLLRNLKRIGTTNLFLICWVVTTFLIFQSAHSKLTSYILPCFPALALLTGDFIYNAVTEKKRKIFVISLLTWLVLLPMPAGVFFALNKFSHYLSSKAPVYWFIAVFAAWLILMFVFLRKQKIFSFICTLAWFPFLFLALMPFVHENMEPYISSRQSSEYLLKNHDIKNTILCSKPYLRGIHYWSGKDVAILSPYAKNYFSPHPVPFLGSDELAGEFIKKQGVTYAVLRKNAIEDIERIAKANGFKVTQLKIIGNEYLLKVEPGTSGR